MKGVVVVVVAVVVLLHVRLVRAADDEFVVDLVSGSEEPPRVVCVAAPRTRDQNNVETPVPEGWDFVDRAFGVPGSPCDATSDLLVTGAAATAPATSPVGAPEWTYGGCAPLPQKSAEDVYRPARLLRAVRSRDVVFHDQGACSPRIVLPPTNKIVRCEQNPLAGPNATGVAVIGIEFGLSLPRRVKPFTVDGNLVTIRLDGKAQSAVSVRLAGGHYEQTATKAVAAGRAQLPLGPICYERKVAIPMAEGTTAGARMTLADRDGWTAAVTTIGQVATVLLPPLEQGKTARLVLDYPVDYPDERPSPGRPPVEGRGPVGGFAASWTSRAPPERLDLRATQISFGWSPPCEYPFKGECPDVRLAETGQTGHGTLDAGICRYRFSAPADSTLTLPAELAFSMHSLPLWQSKLSGTGAVLHDYVPPDGRMFHVVFPWANEATKTADRIDSLEIVGPAGTHHLLKPQMSAPAGGARAGASPPVTKARALVSLPYAMCGGRFSYRLNGTRDYDWGSAEIEDGTITIDTPAHTATFASLGLMVGGGFEISATRGETRPYAQGELAVRLRLARWRDAPWYTRPDYEVALGYILTRQPYEPLRTADNKESRELEAVFYNRFLVTGYALLPVTDSILIGPGLGVGVGYSLLSKDDDRVGGAQLFGVLPAARVRYDVSRRMSLVLNGRFLAPDYLYRFSASSDFRGSPTSEARSQAWVFVDVAIEGWL